MTIEQTVEIPASHRITIDVPREIPAGKVKVELTFSPLAVVHQVENREKIHLSKTMIDDLLQGEALRSLTGLLHTETSAEEIRAERLKKHDHIA